MRKKLFRAFCLAMGVGGLTTWTCAALRGLNRAQDQVNASLPVAVFFQSNLPDSDTQSLSGTLKAHDSAIESVSYVSRDQAYAEASKDPLLSRSLMLLHDNPLSAVAELHYTKEAWLTRQDPAQDLHALPGVQEIRWNPARRDALFAFEPWKRAAQRMLWGVTLVLMIAALLGVHNFAKKCSEWRMGTHFLLTGTLGAACTLALWPLLLPGQPYPVLPVLLGGLLGMGSFEDAER